VDELAACWKDSERSRRLGINLKAVTYIDEGGVKLLKEMHGRGVAIEGSGCMTASIIEAILQEQKS
jgi:hypothetical protein